MEGIDVMTLPILGSVSDLCPLPSPSEVTYWQNRGSRIFTIDYELDDDYNVMDLQKAILQINYDDMNKPESELQPIIIQIHSFGGDLHQAYAIADTILTSRTPVITVAASVAMSAGFIILIAGHKRYALPHSQALVHAGYAAFEGTASEVEQAQKNYKRMQSVDKQFVLEQTEIPESTYNRQKNKDWYLSVDDMLKYKVIDGVVEKITDIFKI
jgi:ATP-dependent Clp protease protease subunit